MTSSLGTQIFSINTAIYRVWCNLYSLRMSFSNAHNNHLSFHIFTTAWLPPIVSISPCIHALRRVTPPPSTSSIHRVEKKKCNECRLTYLMVSLQLLLLLLRLWLLLLLLLLLLFLWWWWLLLLLFLWLGLGLARAATRFRSLLLLNNLRIFSW